MEKEIEIVNNYEIYCYENYLKKAFINEFECIKTKIGATYMSYIYIDEKIKKSLVFFSHEEWQYQMINNKRIYSCPVVKVALKLLSEKKSNFATLWNYVKATNKEELEVINIKSELNIANGFSFSQQHKNIKEGIGLAGDIRDTDFYKQFLLNPYLVQNIFKDIRKILTSCKSSIFNFEKYPSISLQ